MNTYDIERVLINEIQRVIAQERMRNLHFKDNNYRILMGYRIADYLMRDIVIYEDNINSCQRFMGIPCSFDSTNPYVIELLESKQNIDFKHLLTSVI